MATITAKETSSNMTRVSIHGTRGHKRWDTVGEVLFGESG